MAELQTDLIIRPDGPPAEEAHINDLVQHEIPGGPGELVSYTDGWGCIEAVGEGHRCACGPNVQHIQRTDGPDGWIVVHHSLDRREKTE